MVFIFSNVQSNLQSLSQTIDRHVCHQVEPQTCTLCLTSPRRQRTDHKYIEHLVGESGRICLLSCSSHSKGHSKMNTYEDALVLRPNDSVNKTSIATTSLASPVETTIQLEIPWESVVSQSSCLEPLHHPESLESFPEQVADKIEEPQRSASRRLYESRWSIFELWCKQNPMVSSNLKPSTIAGCTTATPGHLGNFWPGSEQEFGFE